MSFPPLITPPTSPLELDDQEVFLLPRTIGTMVGEGRARDAVTEGVLRPADIESAEIGPIEAIWVPFWRIQGSVDAFSIDLRETVDVVRRGKDVGVLGGGGQRPPKAPRGHTTTRRRTRPQGGFRHQDATLAILGRHGFPIDPGPKLKLSLSDLIPAAEGKLDAKTTVLPDTTEDEARETAEHTLRRRGQPNSALFASVNVTLRDARLCFYPLYVVRYRYGGEAVDGSSIFFVAVSGTTGKVVASHHPGVLRSVGSRFKRLFGG